MDLTRVLFKPGTYNVDVKVGYYTSVAGLGLSPDDVTINGLVQVEGTGGQGEPGGQDGVFTDSALVNFWPSAENMHASDALNLAGCRLDESISEPQAAHSSPSGAKAASTARRQTVVPFHKLLRVSFIVADQIRFRNKNSYRWCPRGVPQSRRNQIGFDWTDFHRFRIRKKDYAVPRLGGLACHDAREIN